MSSVYSNDLALSFQYFWVGEWGLYFLDFNMGEKILTSCLHKNSILVVL